MEGFILNSSLMNNYTILGKPSTLAQQIGYDDSTAQSSEALSSTFTAGVGALSVVLMG